MLIQISLQIIFLFYKKVPAEDYIFLLSTKHTFIVFTQRLVTNKIFAFKHSN